MLARSGQVVNRLRLTGWPWLRSNDFVCIAKVPDPVGGIAVDEIPNCPYHAPSFAASRASASMPAQSLAAISFFGAIHEPPMVMTLESLR